MRTMSFITPISYDKIKNLSITDYLIICIDENNKLKRIIPDFNESIISSEDSLINELPKADRCGIFRIISRKEYLKTKKPTFSICIDEFGIINSYTEDTVKLDNLLLDKKRRENVSKILKKKR